MRSAYHTFYTIITTVSIGVIAITLLAVFVQDRSLLRSNKVINEQVQRQTTINQRYLKCIILLPAEAYKDIPSRIKALDKCAADSRSIE